MFGAVGQAMANTMACSSMAMMDEGESAMADCVDMEMGKQRGNSKKTDNCCFGDCAVMMQFSQTNATVSGYFAFQVTTLSVTPRFLNSLTSAPDSIAGLPEIRPPITA